MTEQTIFLTALDYSSAERAAYLDQACAGNQNMRRRVDELLAAHERSGEFLDDPALAQIAAHTPPAEQNTRTFTADAHSTPGDRTAVTDPVGESLGYLKPPTRTGSLGRLEHYEILEQIGVGGFGTVFRAFDDRLHRVVAIKVLSPAYAANGAARRRFIREARTAAAVKNEHVVGIYDVEEDAQPPYLAMEMIDGNSLQEKLDKTGPLGVKEILRIASQTAEGLAAAHKQGLVHRDIKPANILLENGVERVKITDFGLARAVDDASVTQSGTVAGTPMYMSPEQAEGLPVDHRSDLFSLGTVLYAMCTGHPPFRASGTHAVLKRVIEASPRPIREINDEIPDWLCDIIGKLHAKKPDDRFQTAREVAELLQQHLAHLQQPGTVPIPSPVNVGALGRPEAIGVAVPRKSFFFWLGLTTACSLFVFGPVILVGGTMTKFAAAVMLAAAPFGFAGVIYTLAKRLEQNRTGTGRGSEASARNRWRGWVLAIAAALAMFLIAASWLGGPLVRRAKGTGLASLDANEPAATVEFRLISGDNQVADQVAGTITMGRAGANSVELPAGTYEARVILPDDKEVGIVSINHANQWNPFADDNRLGQLNMSFFRVDIRPGWKTNIHVLAANVVRPKEQPGDWISLFNGKNLDGWKTLDEPESWKVENAVLSGKASKGTYGNLELLGKELQNFQLRAKVKTQGPGSGAIYFRGGYLCRIGKGKSGSIMGEQEGKDWDWLFLSEHTPVRDAEWFDLELIVNGPFLSTIINGQRVASVANELHTRGPLYLQVDAREGDIIVQFEKIEMKELSSSPPNESWIQLFDHKTLLGWQKDAAAPGAWQVINGVLVGSNGPGRLYTERNDFQNFHLRAEVAINRGADADIYFRSQMQPPNPPGKPRSPSGYVVDLAEGQDRYTGPVSYLNPKDGAWTTQGANSVVKPDEWFTLDVIADGNHLVTKVNGVTAVDFIEDAKASQKGHIALQVWKPDTVVQFRKIEIRELPASPSTPEEKRRDDLARLNGEWAVRVGKADGKELTAKSVVAKEIHFKDGDFELRYGDAGPDTPRGSYGIDAEKKELILNLYGEHIPVRCSYRFEGDRLSLDFPKPQDFNFGNTEPFVPDPGVTSILKLRKLGLALHIYHDTNNALPPAAITNSMTKKPLLSWRVALLPALGQEQLYRQFKLDEPWDSEHNKKLIDKMPRIYAPPGVAGAESGLTRYRAFVGPGTAFEVRSDGAEGLKLRDFPDGLVNTVLVVESREPVIWTKPEELPFDPKKPLPKLGWFSAGAHAVMGDGSVATFLPTAPDDGPKSYITRNGGESPNESVLKSRGP